MLLFVEHAVGVRAVHIQPQLLLRSVLQKLTNPGPDLGIILKPDVDSLPADGLRDANPDAVDLESGTTINGFQMLPIHTMDIDADGRGKPW